MIRGLITVESSWLNKSKPQFDGIEGQSPRRSVFSAKNRELWMSIVIRNHRSRGSGKVVVQRSPPAPGEWRGRCSRVGVAGANTVKGPLRICNGRTRGEAFTGQGSCNERHDAEAPRRDTGHRATPSGDRQRCGDGGAERAE